MPVSNEAVVATRADVLNKIETHQQTGILNARQLWPGYSGTVQLNRSGNRVELAVWGAPNDASAGTQMVLPDGFRPPATRLFNDAAYTEKQGSRRVNVYPNGRVVVYDLPYSEPVYFTISWHTEEPFPEATRI